jgi:hypothetical protein
MAVAVNEDIRRVTKAYLEAIITSVETASHGIIFAEDAVDLCSSLMSPSSSDVSLFTKEVRMTASQAHAATKRTLQKFNDVRCQVVQV